MRTHPFPIMCSIQNKTKRVTFRVFVFTVSLLILVINPRTTWAAALSGTNPCEDGPFYFCSSLEKASECGIELIVDNSEVISDCNKYCDDDNYPDIKNGDLCKAAKAPYIDPLMDGDSRSDNANLNVREEPSMVIGSNPCEDGPAYVCSSMARAAECTEVVSSEELIDQCLQYCNDDSYPEIKNGDLCKSDINSISLSSTKESLVLGKDRCTEGPSFFCSSFANAEFCNISNALDVCLPYCQGGNYPSLANSDICLSAPTKVDATQNQDELLGNDRCTEGPNYYCSSHSHALKCNIANPVEQCKKYCTSEYPAILGSTLCPVF